MLNITNSKSEFYARNSCIFIVFSYAFAISLFIDSESRNYLTIIAAAYGGVLFILFNLKFGSQALMAGILFALMSINALVNGLGDFFSMGLTFVYAIGYFAISSLFSTVNDKQALVRDMMSKVIYAFAIVSIVQFLAYEMGLPVLNLIESKGSSSFNSLAFEPSQLGRIVGMSMLCYIVTSRIGGVLNQKVIPKRLIIAFLTTMILSGSTLALISLVVIFLLVLMRSSIPLALIAGCLFFFFIGMFGSLDSSRSLSFIAALSSFDVLSIVEADSSGGMRLAAFFIYLQEFSLIDSKFWFGYGSQGLSEFFLYAIVVAGDGIFAGFLPGFAVVYGSLLFVFFLWVFVFKQINKITYPLVIFFFIFFSWSAWNTQVFWYGLILLQITWIVSLSHKIHQGE